MSDQKNYFDRIAEIGQLVIISGPIGVGKRTLIADYLSTHPNAVQCTTVTTREPREGEEEGREHYFISNLEFDRMVRTKQLLEHTYIGRVGYGTPVRQVEKARQAGHNVILMLGVIEALNARAMCPDATLIFIVSPTWEELKERINKREGELGRSVEDALVIAQEEILCADQYDYVIINDEVEKTVRRLDQIIHGNRYSRNSMKGFIESYIESELASEFVDEIKNYK